jgi:hypothetical protein
MVYMTGENITVTMLLMVYCTMALEAAFTMTLDRISMTSMGKKGREIMTLYNGFRSCLHHDPGSY